MDMMQGASWIEVLARLPGLNLHEKSRARIIILAKPPEERELYLQGTYAEAAATIKALLRETSAGDLDSAPSADTLAMQRRRAAAAAALYDRMAAASPRSSASSASSTTSSTRRRLASELLLETAAAISHLGKLPAAFRGAHFRASQPGDVYYCLVKDCLPPPANANSGPGRSDFHLGFERVRVQFAMVMGVPSPSSSPSTTASGSGSLSPTPSFYKSEDPDSVVAIRIRSYEVNRWRPQPSLPSESATYHVTEWEAEMVPEPADNLEAVSERLERGAVRPAEVLWWRGSAGKWTLWNGSPVLSRCVSVWKVSD